MIADHKLAGMRSIAYLTGIGAMWVYIVVRELDCTLLIEYNLNSFRIFIKAGNAFY